MITPFLNRQAAKDANSIFEAEMTIKRIYKDGLPLWEIAKKEQADDHKLEIAEEHSEIPDIVDDEKQEIKDIEDLVNQTFKILRTGVLLIHTELHQLKNLMQEDDILRHSSFPIEVSDQLEEMLKKEMTNIMFHLRTMGEQMENDEGL